MGLRPFKCPNQNTFGKNKGTTSPNQSPKQGSSQNTFDAKTSNLRRPKQKYLRKTRKLKARKGETFFSSNLASIIRTVQSKYKEGGKQTFGTMVRKGRGRCFSPKQRPCALCPDGEQVVYRRSTRMGRWFFSPNHNVSLTTATFK